MGMKYLGNVEIQYVSCYFTRKMKVLFADRRKRMNPILHVYSNELDKTLIFEVNNIIVDNQRKANVKEGLDLYMIKSEVTKLKGILNALLLEISSQVTLDRSTRVAKDPRYVYVQTGGLEIPIEVLESWAKVKEIKADYATEGYSAYITRKKPNVNEPALHFEKEHKQFWDESRMHLGIHLDWEEVKDSELTDNKITIKFPWEELGHVIGRVIGSERKM